MALDGISSNGSDYIESAVEKGAVRVVCREGTAAGEFEGVCVIYTPDPFSWLLSAFKNEYSQVLSKVKLIGVTGTNGKTTTCYLISRAMTSLGINCAYIGTIGFYLKEKVRDLPNTSVDIASLYELLLECCENGFNYVALEASSQGLDLGRFETVRFDVAVFTNLTEDHLDYHKTMENYAAAKRILFEKLKPEGLALLNSDDEAWKQFALPGVTNYTYGKHSYEDFSFSVSGSEYFYRGPGCGGSFKTKLIGEYNYYNLLACIGVMKLFGIEDGQICAACAALNAPEGRCEAIEYMGSRIVIDYAHTPDAMEKIIASARTFTKGNIYIVFGCTGDREREKRPVMTRIALEGSSFAVITVDDPHFEAAESIFRDMLSENPGDNYVVIEDRREAIRKGISLLKEGDTLLILGKGHEKFINYGDRKVPHNDKEAVLEEICR